MWSQEFLFFWCWHHGVGFFLPAFELIVEFFGDFGFCVRQVFLFADVFAQIIEFNMLVFVEFEQFVVSNTNRAVGSHQVFFLAIAPLEIRREVPEESFAFEFDFAIGC